ncbi:choice-of-anchor D domain-containing protein [Luteolibacter luteus]|uniref:Choice-of-anchor D domain-containing protein n=1 Tax=Luteolibacter luteus TaxID=2728835 RepID=A0A858RJ53_9BACT|nr:choice-of-anchor D domain-containing protein [Luteolibacter luteus]QJE96554.1 choice-of-anchor D domain-containing protein [Luteolibacter luteus]
MNFQFPAFTRLCLSSLLLASALPAGAAPQLRVERDDGSEITRKRHATVWMDGELVRIEEKQDADLVNLTPGYWPGLVYSDGTARVVDASTTTLCPIGDVKSLVANGGVRPVLTQDGSVHYWFSGSLPQVPSDLGIVTAIAAGYEHVVALRQDGTVAAWGGVNPNVVPLKVQVPEYLSEVVEVAASGDFSLALRSNGTVAVWGAVVGSPPSGLGQVKQIAAYSQGAMALKTDGSVRVWGSVTSGRNPPAGVGPLSQIAVSNSTTAGIRADGSVATWGASSFTLLPGLGEADGVACGSDCVVATTPQRIESFGVQPRGIPIERTFTIRNTGDQALDLSGVTLTGTAGNDFTLDASQLPASLPVGQSGSFRVIFTPSDLTTKASLLSFESNDPAHASFRFSVSGKGSNLPPVAADHSASVAEDSPADIVLPTSDPNGDPLSLFIPEQSAGGTLSNFTGNTVRFTPDRDFTGTFTFTYRASDGSLSSEKRSVTISVTPVNDPPFIHFPGDQLVRSSVAGAGTVVPLKVSGGDVEDGLVSPVLRVNGQVIGPDHVFPPGVTVVEVTVTDNNGIATVRTFEVRVIEGPCLSLQYPSGRPTQKSGQVLAWGDSAYGAVAVPQGLADAVAISGGSRHSVALREDGTVVAWGWNNSGQTVVPEGLSDVIAIAAGGAHTLALKSDGTVRTWGASSATSGMPAGLTGVVAIAAGSTHSLALKSDGSVVAWGSDYGGTEVPPDLSGVAGVFAGSGASYAVKENGSVVAWGRADQGQLQVPSWLSGVESISSMSFHSVARRSDGSVVVWGGESNRLLSEIPTGAAFARSVSAGGNFHIAALEDGSTSYWGGFVNNSFYPPSSPAGIDMVAAGDGHALGIQYRTEQLSFRMPVAVSALPRTLRIANPGTSDLQITGLSITGTHPADFTVERSGLPGVLPPAASGSFEIRFLPAALGQREATLLIQTNDPLSPSRSIKLTGTWTNTAPVTSSLSGLVLDEDAPGGLEITLPATDVNGQTLSYSIVTPPAAVAGTLGPVVGNKVIFTPALDYHGSVGFTFKASDGFNESNVSSVSLTINPVEDAPRLILPGSPWVVPTLEAGGSIVDFLVDAFDAEDGWISYVVTSNGLPVSSGDYFPFGDTIVEVTAMDSAGRTATGSFVVRVVSGADMVVEEGSGGALSRRSLVTGWGANSSNQLAPPSGLGPIIALATGYEHSLAVKAGGTVVAWGNNANGKATVPEELSGVVQVAAGLHHSVALKSDGTVVVWGWGDSDLQPPAGLPPVKAISSARGHIVALCQDGSVVAWGDNSYNQCVVPSGLGEVVEVAAGGYHCVALKKNGTVVTWGRSNSGLSPVPAGLTGVKSVRCGDEHTLVLKKDGTVAAWGVSQDGQTLVPAGLSGVTAIAAGAAHSIALKSDGTLVAWGSNSNNQSTVPAGLGKALLISANGQHSLVYVDEVTPLGFGSVDRPGPLTKVFTIRNQGPGVLEIDDFHLTGVDAASFQLQAGATDLALATGESTTFSVTFSPGRNGPHAARLRIKTNDTTRPEWDFALSGHGFNGSPVTPDLTGLTTPEDISLFISLPATDPESDPLTVTFGPVVPSNAGTIGTPVGKNFLFTPAANFNGPVSFVYRASDGGTTSEGTVSFVVMPVNDPPVVSYLPGLVRVFSPDHDGAAVGFRPPVISDPEDGSIAPVMTIAGQPFTNGSVLAPGSYTVSVSAADSTGSPVSGSFPISVIGTTGASARLEDDRGVKLTRSSPIVEWDRSGLVPVAGQGVPPDLRGVKQITAGNDHVVALRNDGTVSGWGASTMNRLSIPADLTNATAIAAGINHTVALRTNGTVAAWGDNSSGQCNVPAGLSGIVAVAAGGDRSMALRSNGTVVVWGSGGFLTPPAGLTGVTAIAAGQFYCIALKSDGTVVAWGGSSPSIPPGLSGVVAIASGLYHSVALKSDGKVIAFGNSSLGQTLVPANLSGVTAISAGPYHTMALKSDGTLAAWGSYVENFRIVSVPASVKNVTAMDGGYGRLSAVVDSPCSLDLGKAAAGSPVTKTVRIHNRGTAPLAIAGIQRLAGSSASITHSTQGMNASVPVGGSTTFAVTFTPSGLGSAAARFRITSNDWFEPMMDLAVMAESTTPYLAWAHTAGLAGNDASSDAEPFDDGLINLVKYAFNMDGSRQDNHILVPGTGLSGLPHISVEGSGDHSFLRVEFVRRRAGGVSYTVQASPDLLEEFKGVTISPDVFPIDDIWERVVVRKPFDPALEPLGFARVRVTF